MTPKVSSMSSHVCSLAPPLPESCSPNSWCPENHPGTDGQKGHLANLQSTSVGNDSGRLVEFHYQVTKHKCKEETLSPLRMLRVYTARSPTRLAIRFKEGGERDLGELFLRAISILFHLEPKIVCIWRGCVARNRCGVQACQ